MKIGFISQWIWGVVFVLLSGVSAHALDTIEVYPPKAVYTEGALRTGEGATSLSALAGYGMSVFINPFVDISIPLSSGGDTAITFGNISTVYSEAVDVDVVPTLTMVSGTNFLGLTSEVSKAFGSFTPYAHLNLFDKAATSWDFGASYMLFVGGEIMGQVTPGQAGGESIFAGGFNYVLLPKLELISALHLMGSEALLHVGAIWIYEL